MRVQKNPALDKRGGEIPLGKGVRGMEKSRNSVGEERRGRTAAVGNRGRWGKKWI